MNEEQIKIFLAVAKAGSFTKAEDSSHLSKQAMLKQINALEDELGVRLLSRSRTGTSLTQAGQLFQKGMQKISRDMDQLIRSCRETAGNENRLKVGNVEHQALLTPVTQAFSARYPEIEVRHVIHPNHSGEWRVAEGIQDVAETFSLACRNNPGLLQKCGYRSLTTVPYMAAMRNSHPLSKKAAVSLSELTRYR